LLADEFTESLRAQREFDGPLFGQLVRRCDVSTQLRSEVRGLKSEVKE
jgi:hypothetical protein